MTRNQHMKKWMSVGAVGAVVLAGGGYLIARSGSTKAASAAPTSDKPRVEGGAIRFSSKFRERVGMISAEVKEAPLTPVVSAVGTVGFDPKHVARVGTRLRGLIHAVKVYEGDSVAKGAVLAEIDSPELGEAQANVSLLGAQAIAANRDRDREKSLAERSLTTAREAEQAEAEARRFEAMLRAARQKVSALGGKTTSPRIGMHTLRAPIEGTVVERHVSNGQLVDGDHTAFLIADLDRLWVELDVFERSLHAIRVGDAVEVKALSGAGEPMKGRVAHVGHVIDPLTRSAAVRIEVDNTHRWLRPGQTVEAKIHASGTATGNAVLIPSDAVTYVDGKPTVFVIEADDAVRPTQVKLGDHTATERQILEGLKPGQKVVVKGVFEIKSELFR